MLEIFPTIACKGAAKMTLRELYKLLFFPMEAHKILDYTLRECDLTDTCVCSQNLKTVIIKINNLPPKMKSKNNAYFLQKVLESSVFNKIY